MLAAENRENVFNITRQQFLRVRMTSSHVLRPINNEHMTIRLQDNIIFTQVRVNHVRFNVSFLHITQNLPQNLPSIWKLPPLSQFRTLNHPHSYSMTILAQRLWHSNTLAVNKLQRMKLSLSCEPRLEKHTSPL